jgi:TetR/AcrR family transcriptional regulator, regulator of autoinduction and epiphytic fitness
MAVRRSASDGDGVVARRPADPTSDKRLVRGSRTRTFLLDATIDLIGAGNPSPTANQVAAHAGVSNRLIFHHFADVDQLFTLAVERQTSAFEPLTAVIPARGPTEVRIRVIARQRRRLFEAIGPALRASYARLPAKAALSEVLARQRRLLRLQLEVILKPEIAARGDQAPEALETLHVITGWQCWSALRFESGHSATRAEQITVFTVDQVLR